MKMLLGILIATAFIVAVGSGGVYDEMEAKYGETWTSQNSTLTPEEADAGIILLLGIASFFLFLVPVFKLFARGEYTDEYNDTTDVGRGAGSGLAVLFIIAVVLGVFFAMGA